MGVDRRSEEPDPVMEDVQRHEPDEADEGGFLHAGYGARQGQGTA